MASLSKVTSRVTSPLFPFAVAVYVPAVYVPPVAAPPSFPSVSAAVVASVPAAVVSPVGELRYKDDVITINDFKIGELTQKLYDTLTGIQWGKLEDKYNWTVEV